MRRVLEHLDPTKAIPDRVRKALDTLTEGVIVLDTNGRVVLANEAFRELHGEDDKVGLSARRASEIPWLQARARRRARGRRPSRGRSRCATARRSPATCSRSRTSPTARARRSSPRARSRTDAARCAAASSPSPTSPSSTARTSSSQRTLSELEASREKIEAQNEELKLLANIDPLTGCHEPARVLRGRPRR